MRGRRRGKKGKGVHSVSSSPHRFRSFSLPLSLFLHLQLSCVERSGEVVEPAFGERLLDQGLRVGHEDEKSFFSLSRDDAIAERATSRRRESDHFSPVSFCIRFDGQKKKKCIGGSSWLSRNRSFFALFFLLRARASRSLLHSPAPLKKNRHDDGRRAAPRRFLLAHAAVVKLGRRLGGQRRTVDESARRLLPGGLLPSCLWVGGLRGRRWRSAAARRRPSGKRTMRERQRRAGKEKRASIEWRCFY